MPADASAQLHRIAAACRAQGAGALRLELLRGLKSGAAPLIPLVHEAALRQLPKAGGLNRHVAAQKVSVSVRTGARTAGVRLTTKDLDTKETDSGIIRHPVFNRRYKDGKRVWIKEDQKIPAAEGWWSKTLAGSGPTVDAGLYSVLRAVNAKLQAGG
jgi:hypothetical protein